MKALIVGRVVDLDENEWTYNGRSGVSYTAFVRSGSDREAAQRVRVTAKQFTRISLDDNEVSWPVDIFPNVNDSGRPTLRVTLDEDFDPADNGSGRRAEPALA